MDVNTTTFAPQSVGQSQSTSDTLLSVHLKKTFDETTLTKVPNSTEAVSSSAVNPVGRVSASAGDEKSISEPLSAMTTSGTPVITTAAAVPPGVNDQTRTTLTTDQVGSSREDQQALGQGHTRAEGDEKAQTKPTFSTGSAGSSKAASVVALPISQRRTRQGSSSPNARSGSRTKQ
ncbi:unnamed protein product, partial [Amoebophrya sp. A25]|eukprot:GSA25T00018873001.1